VPTPTPDIIPLLLSVPLPESASVKVLFPICSVPVPQTPDKRSNAVKPEPEGGTSTTAALFRSWTLRLVKVNEMLVTLVRPPTTLEEPSDAPKVPLTVIPPDEVHVVTFGDVEQMACARAGVNRAIKARKIRQTVGRASRKGMTERSCNDMS
jgi:hypothetical protein